MHASLSELLENLNQGLLWVNRDGTVRYANADAASRTGLGPGRHLADANLLQGVAESVSHQVPRSVRATSLPLRAGRGMAAGGGRELNCRVLPGFERDDAFVLIGQDPAAQDGSAYDNLMRLIRHDLRQPLRNAHDALVLARHSEDVHTVAELGDRLEDLLRLMNKLVDLAGLLGQGSLLTDERVELWPLLQEVWAEIEPVAMDRGVRVRFHLQHGAGAAASMYGSEAWLRRLFLECLESAVRAAPEGSLLDVEHVQIGARALIVFRDTRLFDAGANAREAIGLRLCQHVAALHGGELREDLEDGPRNLVIDLPTGAPHGADQTQLALAQAQKFASEMPALLARARKRGATADNPSSETTF